MLQRSSLPTTSPAEIADSLQRTLDGSLGASLAEPFARRRWQALPQVLQDALPLPATWQQYLLACLAITIVVGGMCLQVLLAVDIARTELSLRQLRGDYARVERQNSELIYAIAQQSSLAQMAKLAAQNGYVPATNRTYVLHSSEARALAPRAAVAALAPNPVLTQGQPQEAADWLQQTRQWWRDFQESIGTATGQLWRDFTGRME